MGPALLFRSRPRTFSTVKKKKKKRTRAAASPSLVAPCEKERERNAKVARQRHFFFYHVFHLSVKVKNLLFFSLGVGNEGLSRFDFHFLCESKVDKMRAFSAARLMTEQTRGPALNDLALTENYLPCSRIQQ